MHTNNSRPIDNVYISKDTDDALVTAENIAKDMKDEYISVEHIALGLIDKANSKLKDLFKTFDITKNRFLKVLLEVRGK